MGVLRSLFNRRKKAVDLPESASSPDTMASSIDDVMEGYTFLATMQLRTPLAVLEQHGRTHPGPPNRLPNCCDQVHGCWIPKIKSLSEIAGIDLCDLPESEGASLIGPVKPSEYIPFLIAVRRIIDADLTDEAKVDSLLQMKNGSVMFGSFWQRHIDAEPGFPYSLFWLDLLDLPGVGATIAQALYASGIRSVYDVARAEVSRLITIPGIGPATARRIRQAAETLDK